LEKKEKELLQERIRAVRILYSVGVSKQEIANKTGYDLDFINRIISEM
jgi:transposase